MFTPTLNSGLTSSVSSKSIIPNLRAMVASFRFQNSVNSTLHTAITTVKKGMTGWEKSKYATTTHSNATPIPAGTINHWVSRPLKLK